MSERNLFPRLRGIRAILAAGVALRALVWGLAAAATLLVGAAIVDLAVPLTLGVRGALLSVAVIAALLVALALAWRDRAVLSLARVALWVEETFPALEYTVATAVETGDERFVKTPVTAPWTRTAWRRALRVLRVPIAVVVAAFVVLLALPAGAVARVRAPRPGDSLERPGIGSRRAGRLSPLVADVVPPAYSGQRATTLDEPTDLRALAGSALTLRGRGSGEGIVARIGADSVAATTRGGRWMIALHVPRRAVAIRLEDGPARRIVAVEPIADNPPVVVMTLPARDSVLRAATGRITLAADASDDLGIASASFEYIVSSGEGETFTFRSGVLGAVRPAAGTVSLSASLRLDSLALKPGDILHLRAVARDANDASGPGVGVSETRAIRIARPDEYDSVSVEAAAPSETDNSLVSERMLITLAEALQKKRPALARPTLLSESQSIAADQKKLRRTVGDVVFMRLGAEPSGEEHSDEENPQRARTMDELLHRADSATTRSMDPIDFEGGESPVVAVNRPLLEAYNAMWDASVHLELGEPERALPFMHRALDAIQRARKAERLYLRGAAPRVVIDIDKARLKGKDKGSSSVRHPLASGDSAAKSRVDRFSRIVELAGRDPRAAIDSILVLRVDALAEAPAFAAALSDAAKAMRAGRGEAATAALARARRSLAGQPFARDSLGRWNGGMLP